MSQRTLFNPDLAPAAIISPCGTYRYTLRRGAMYCGYPDVVNFIMLNPSTADAETDDPTIRRCVGYARSWGYYDLVVTNLFGLRATDPKALRSHPEPVGPDNDRHLIETARNSSTVVCAWGADPMARPRAVTILSLLRSFGIRPHALRLTKDGQPCHPLYLPADLEPFAWEASPCPS